MTLPTKTSLDLKTTEILTPATDHKELATTISHAVCSGLELAITNVLKSPELSALIGGITRANGITGILQGLAAADGRKALDARVTKQNALEIYHVIESALEAAKDRLQEKTSGVELDPEVHDAEAEYKQFLEKNKINDHGV